jgi:gas vesicle protein GvpA/GvpJ/GvpM family
MPDIVHTTDGANLADVLERVLDKGIVIAGDIRIKLVEVDLLTISIRLLIASVDKAREIGIDWWSHSSFLGPQPAGAELDALRARLDRLENAERVTGER